LGTNRLIPNSGPSSRIFCSIAWRSAVSRRRPRIIQRLDRCPLSGVKRTLPHLTAMSAFGPKADVGGRNAKDSSGGARGVKWGGITPRGPTTGRSRIGKGRSRCEIRASATNPI
jgi:hypothetical protein